MTRNCASHRGSKEGDQQDFVVAFPNAMAISLPPPLHFALVLPSRHAVSLSECIDASFSASIADVHSRDRSFMSLETCAPHIKGKLLVISSRSLEETPDDVSRHDAT
jgi:hypothetical protein